ncbi:MAG: prolyl aminopeptidase [Actinomycetota bacterium]
MKDHHATDLFPPIEPHDAGWLPVDGGHQVYWEVSGNPEGVPVLFLHGGPGAGTAPAYRRFFDPAFWRIVLFDQRGCGRSRPTAAIEANTTADLVADIEALRRHLGVARWLQFGGSWGSTLALAYGQAHPGRCLGFVLRGIFLFRQAEVDWFMSGMGRFFPEAAQRLAAPLPEDERADMLAAYYRRLTHADPAVHLPAARAWCAYEEACARLLPRIEAGEADPMALLSMARLEAHYMVNRGFLAENALLDGLGRISHLPATIVQGRYDVICPPSTAAELAAAWPGARLTMVPDAGHSAMEPPTRSALVAAVERMKRVVAK